MAFTDWGTLRTNILNAISDYVEGAPCTGSYTIGGKTMNYRSIDELKELYKMTFELEAIDDSGVNQKMVSYGRYSRYK